MTPATKAKAPRAPRRASKPAGVPAQAPADGDAREGAVESAPPAAGTGSNIPASHPRYASLRVRERMKDAVTAGWVHPTGLIAHGRGEAFDYLLGEKTPPEAVEAIQEAARRIRAAKRPVLSLNGNVVALAAGLCDSIARAWPSITLEVNLFHRSEERVAKLVRAMEKSGAIKGTVLGAKPDFQIPGLDSDRGRCCKAGIGTADLVIVPLEDGDRCQALKRMGKTVVTIDLNPLSRTARMADITIVDELTRALPLLDKAIRAPKKAERAYDNEDVLTRVKARMAAHLASGF
ncbi:MAG TPA: phosphopantothenate/pantothenate synthetase [Candidatus Thermoplasmatota archaeon]|nr:phosphopantothenate/pantothenate synthetase [Candidatus Thermoplasmatota archaeon]